MAGMGAAWIFYAGILSVVVAAALLFIRAIRRDRRLALLLIPAGLNAALVLGGVLFYGQLSIQVSSYIFQAFLVLQLLLVAFLIYFCRRRWVLATLLGALDLTFAVPAAAIGAMALADSWL